MLKSIRPMIAWVLVIALLSGTAMAQQSTQESFEVPFLGKVKATELNVRSGMSEKHSILAKLNYGETVTVLEAQPGWFRVETPANVTMFVYTKYLFASGDTTAEVTATALNVRSGPDVNKPSYGQVKRGDMLTVLGTQGDWTQIAPPEWFGAWVSSDFVDYVSPSQTAPADTIISSVLNDSEVQARTLFEVANEHYQFECNKAMEEWEFSAVTREYENILSVTSDANLTELVNSRLAMIDLRCKMRDQISASVESNERQAQAMSDIESKYQALLEERRRREAAAAEEENYDAVGWLLAAGKFIGRPSPWRLEMGGRQLVYVDVPASSEMNLEDFGSSLVGVKGRIVERKGESVLLVESITILKR